MSSDSVPARRTGGRSALVIAAVRDAVEDLIAESGADKVTVPAVAARAGVSPSSIYRRWGDVGSLVAEVATLRLDPDRPLPDTGNIGDDLREWARELYGHLARPTKASLLRASAVLADDGETNCLASRRDEAERLVERAHARGQVTPSVRQIMDHLVAPIIYRITFEPDTVDTGFPETLVGELDRITESR